MLRGNYHLSLELDEFFRADVGKSHREGLFKFTPLRHIALPKAVIKVVLLSKKFKTFLYIISLIYSSNIKGEFVRKIKESICTVIKSSKRNAVED